MYKRQVLEGKQDVVYVQRVINASSNLRGYKLEEIAKKAHEGIPSIIMTSTYPYEVKRPKRQFAVVMDLNKCIACQTCTVACKPTWTPGRGQEYML